MKRKWCYEFLAALIEYLLDIQKFIKAAYYDSCIFTYLRIWAPFEITVVYYFSSMSYCIFYIQGPTYISSTDKLLLTSLMNDRHPMLLIFLLSDP